MAHSGRGAGEIIGGYGGCVDSLRQSVDDDDGLSAESAGAQMGVVGGQRGNNDEAVHLLVQQGLNGEAFHVDVLIGVRDEDLVTVRSRGVDDGFGGPIEKGIGEVGDDH